MNVHDGHIADALAALALELWVRPQPSGIRAEDALAWARMIVERYEGTLSTSNNAQARE